MTTFDNDSFKREAVVAAIGLCEEAMRALALAVQEVRRMLPEAAIPTEQRAEVAARAQVFISNSGERLNEFVDTALTRIGERFTPHTINHIVETYAFGGPLALPPLEWLCQLTNEFTEQWVTDLYKEIKPRLETN